MEDSGSVTREFRHFDHRGIFPQAKLVLAEPVGAQNLLLVLAPLQRTHLGLSIDAVDTHTSVRVPEFDAAVSSSTTGSEQVTLEGAPGQGFDGSLVVIEAVEVGR